MTLEELRKERLEGLRKLGRLRGILVEQGVLLTPEDGFKLYKLAFFGNPIGVKKAKQEEKYNVPYILSPFEALYLMKKGVLEVWNENELVSEKKLVEVTRKIIGDFESKYKVYEDLRDRGYVVRPGMKFGSDFAVYIYGPGIDHAPFLVTVFSEEKALRGVELIRAGRLANSVRKAWVIATITGEGIRYYTFIWARLR